MEKNICGRVSEGVHGRIKGRFNYGKGRWTDKGARSKKEKKRIRLSWN